MADDARIDYRVTRNAPLRGDDDVLWVSIARWVHGDGGAHWCLEYWDDVGEADNDLELPDEAAALQRAREEFGIEDADWRQGPQPWDHPDDS